MISLRRLCATSAVTFALYPIQVRIAEARRINRLRLGTSAEDQETPGQSAMVETALVDPISATVLSGLAAAGSICSIGKTIVDVRGQSRRKTRITTVIKKYQKQSVAGCKMLDTAAAFLLQKMHDLDILYKDMDQLQQVCSDRSSQQMKTYTTLLRTRLEDTCKRSPEALQEHCHATYTADFEANIAEACSMSMQWGTQAAVESAKMELHKHIWQMDGLKRGTCGEGISGARGLSLVEHRQAKSKSSAFFLDTLGLAFSLLGWADIMATMGDHAISKVWSNGVQGLLEFTEHKAKQAQTAVCDTFTTIWLKSFVPGNAAKLTSLGLRMNKMGVAEDTVLDRLARLTRLADGEDPEDWGLEQETVFLCDHEKFCMTPMPSVWSEYVNGKTNRAVGGLSHPSASCFGVDEDDEMHLVRICSEWGDVINAVPQECLRMYTVMPTKREKEAKIGTHKEHKIIGRGRAFEFLPDSDAYFPGPVRVEDEYLSRDKCLKPLRMLWNIELEASTANLADACPRQAEKKQ